MKIKLDNDHYLNSDDQCYWITCIVRSDKAKKPYEKRVSGYVQTFSLAVDTFIERKIRGSQTEGFEELKNEVEELKQTVKSWENPRVEQLTY